MEKLVIFALIAVLVCVAGSGSLLKRLKKTKEAAGAEIKKSEEKYRALFEFTREGLMTTDSDGRILSANSAAAEMLGYDRPEEILSRNITEFYLYPDQRKPLYDELMKTGYMENYLLTLRKKDSTLLYTMGSDMVRRDSNGKILQIETSLMNITRQKLAEEELQNAQLEARYCQEEKTAFLNALRSAVRYNDFEESAKAVFNICKSLAGATAGYIAFLNEDKTGDRVVFSDPADGTMPLSSMHGEVYRTSKPIYINDFPKTEGIKHLPDHELPNYARPFNVLLVPIIMSAEIKGILCLLNKPAGFNGNDARIAFIFGEIIALAGKVSYQ